eukprot:gene2164-1333_t
MGDVNGCCNEVKATGILGCLGISQIDWGGNACYEVWKCAPCCGGPDLINALLCLFNCWCCGPCMNCKLYATSLGQKCAFFPHCVCCCFCGPCMTVFTRYNLRRKAGVKGNMVGDWICTCCCGCCACCQNLRSVPIAGWRVVPEVEVPDLIASNICSFFSINVSYLIESCIDICLWWRHPDHSPAAAVCLRRYCRGAVLVPPRWPRRLQPVDVLGAWADIVHGRRRSFFVLVSVLGGFRIQAVGDGALRVSLPPRPPLSVSPSFVKKAASKLNAVYWIGRGVTGPVVCAWWPDLYVPAKHSPEPLRLDTLQIGTGRAAPLHTHTSPQHLLPLHPLLPPTAVGLTPASPYDVLCTVLSRVIMPLSLSLSLSPLTAAPHPRYCTSHPPTPPDPHTCPLQSLRLLCCSPSLYLNRVIMGHFNACFQELKEVNWGDNACYDCCTCNPCCGSPDLVNALRCFANWLLCVHCKLSAAPMDQEVAIVFTRYGLRRRSGGTGKTVGDWICMCCGWRVIPECDTADLSRTALLLYFGKQQQQQHWMRAGEGCVRVCCVCRSSLFGVRGMGCSLLGGPLREVDRGVLMGACTSFYSAIHRMDSAKPKAEPQRKPIPSLSLSQRFPGEDEGRSRSVLFLFDSLLCSLRRVFIVSARGTEYQKIKQKKAQPPCKGTVFPGPCSPYSCLLVRYPPPPRPSPPLSVVLSRPFASLLWFPPSSLGVVKATGILGCLGISQIDWGGNACYEVWKCAPCCGGPDLINALLCLFNCWCCGPCMNCKLYATSLGQKCAFFPHCVCCCFCGPCMTVFTRYNLRRKAGVKGNMVGDWICTCCCGCCACCQNLRSVPIAGWRVVPEVEVPDLIASNICSFFSINVSYLIESCIDICLWWRHPDHSPAAAVCLRRYCRGAVLVPPRWPRRLQPVDVLGAWADIVHGRRRSFFVLVSVLGGFRIRILFLFFFFNEIIHFCWLVGFRGCGDGALRVLCRPAPPSLVSPSFVKKAASKLNAVYWIGRGVTGPVVCAWWPDLYVPAKHSPEPLRLDTLQIGTGRAAPLHTHTSPQHLLPLHPLLPPTAVGLTPASPYDVLCTVLSRVIMPLSLSLAFDCCATSPLLYFPPTHTPDPHTCPLQSLRLLCCSRSLYLNRVIMGHFNACFQELKEVNWGDNACYDCCTCNPCCGSPDLVNALRCFANWLLCVHCKLSAAPMDQEVACSPHCVACCCHPPTGSCSRATACAAGRVARARRSATGFVCAAGGASFRSDTADLSRTALTIILRRLLCLLDKIRPAGGKNNNNNNTGCGRGKAVFVFVVCAGLRCSVCGAWGVHSWEAPFWRWIAAYSWERVPLSTPPFTAWTALSRRPSPSGSPYAFNYTSRFPGEDEGRSRSVLFLFDSLLCSLRRVFIVSARGSWCVRVCARAITSKRQYLSGVPEDKTKEGSAAVQGNGVPGAVQPPISCLLVRYPPPPRPSPPLSVVLSRPFASLLWFPPSSLGVVKATGILGCLGISQIDWGGNACYEVWKCAPCCGGPDPINALLCLFNCWCCGPCMNCKLYATSLGQKCAFFPHCVCCCFCGPCMTVFTRYNLRRKAGVKGNMVGDWICTCCCGCCACCQNLRSVPIAGWRVVPEVEVPDLIASNICSFFSINVSYLIESCIDICLWVVLLLLFVCVLRASFSVAPSGSFARCGRVSASVLPGCGIGSTPLAPQTSAEAVGDGALRVSLPPRLSVSPSFVKKAASKLNALPLHPLLPPTAVALTPASPYDVLCTVLSRVIMPLSLSLSLAFDCCATSPLLYFPPTHTPRSTHMPTANLYLNRVIMGHFNACFQELKEVNWGDNACYDCCTCNPCCGSPDLVNALRCFANWLLCVHCKLSAAPMDQEVACSPLRGVLLPPTHRIVFTRYGLRRRSGGTGKTVGDWICMCCGWRVIPECDTADLSRTALLLYFGSTFFFFSFAVPVGQNTSCWGKEQQQQQHWMRAGEGCVRVCCVCRSSLFGVRGMGCSLLGGPLLEVDRGVLMGACTSFYSAIHRMDSAKPKAEPQRKPMLVLALDPFPLSLSQRFPGEDEGRSRSVLFLFDSLLCSLRRVFIVRARGSWCVRVCARAITSKRQYLSGVPEDKTKEGSAAVQGNGVPGAVQPPISCLLVRYPPPPRPSPPLSVVLSRPFASLLWFPPSSLGVVTSLSPLQLSFTAILRHGLTGVVTRATRCGSVPPCCGGPDLINALLCLFNCWCCGPCMNCKLYATSLGQKCAFFPPLRVLLLLRPVHDGVHALQPAPQGWCEGQHGRRLDLHVLLRVEVPNLIASNIIFISPRFEKISRVINGKLLLHLYIEVCRQLLLRSSSFTHHGIPICGSFCCCCCSFHFTSPTLNILLVLFTGNPLGWYEIISFTTNHKKNTNKRVQKRNRRRKEQITSLSSSLHYVSRLVLFELGFMEVSTPPPAFLIFILAARLLSNDDIFHPNSRAAETKRQLIYYALLLAFVVRLAACTDTPLMSPNSTRVSSSIVSLICFLEGKYKKGDRSTWHPRCSLLLVSLTHTTLHCFFIIIIIASGWLPSSLLVGVDDANKLASSGIVGYLGFTQADWGGNAVYEVWKLSPCCGLPDPFNCVLCVFNWWILGTCSACKLYASSVGQHCSLFPHVACGLLCPLCVIVFTRYNLRRRAGVEGNMVGDAICMICCPCFAFCQNLRSIDAGGWRMLPELQEPHLIASPIRFICQLYLKNLCYDICNYALLLYLGVVRFIIIIIIVVVVSAPLIPNNMSFSFYFFFYQNPFVFVKATGILGCLGISQIDWGGNACYEVWKCAPCCGGPDPINALLCLFNWWCCGPCMNCKLYATSLGQKCAFFPHCVCCCFCGPCMTVFTRYNLRRKAGGKGNMVGDWICMCCCGPCACCQNLRSVDIGGWRVVPEVEFPEIISSNIMIIKVDLPRKEAQQAQPDSSEGVCGDKLFLRGSRGVGVSEMYLLRSAPIRIEMLYFPVKFQGMRAVCVGNFWTDALKRRRERKIVFSQRVLRNYASAKVLLFVVPIYKRLFLYSTVEGGTPKEKKRKKEKKEIQNKTTGADCGPPAQPSVKEVEITLRLTSSSTTSLIICFVSRTHLATMPLALNRAIHMNVGITNCSFGNGIYSGQSDSREKTGIIFQKKTSIFHFLLSSDEWKDLLQHVEEKYTDPDAVVRGDERRSFSLRKLPTFEGVRRQVMRTEKP